MLAEGILVGPETPGDMLIHDDGARGARSILCIEQAPMHEAQVEHIEVLGRDDTTGGHQRTLASVTRMIFSVVNVVVFASAQGQSINKRDGFEAGNGLSAIE